MVHKITSGFPWIISLFVMIAFVYPSLFTWFQGPLITLGLGGIMLGMGVTLKAQDFIQIINHPKWVVLGLSMQFLVMPFLGWGMAKLFELPPFFTVGLILVASCPGGTASNVIAYLAKAEVALSVTMTACSTLAAIFMTPFLTFLYSGNQLEIPTMGLLQSTLKVVLIPITAGILINRYFPNSSKKVIPYAPPVAVLLICLIVASIVGQGKEIILSSGFSLLMALVSLHFLGFILGFIASIILLKNWKVAKTISIEVGMQNSGGGSSCPRKLQQSLRGYPCCTFKFNSFTYR